MRIFHFSEESDIELFKPRVKANRQDMPPVVWAIDDAHQFTFYCPRDCPRIVYTRTDDMSEEDEVRFFGTTKADIVMALEIGWYERIKQTTLYRYELPIESFELFDACAGYYISRETVVPLGKEPMTNLLDHLIALNIELRFVPSLYPLYDAIVASSLLDFGIHRFANASR